MQQLELFDVSAKARHKPLWRIDTKPGTGYVDGHEGGVRNVPA